jgi:hypothetical protein
MKEISMSPSPITKVEQVLQKARREAMNRLREAHKRLNETPEAFEERSRNSPFNRGRTETKAENEDWHLEHAVDAIRDYVIAYLKDGIDR